MYKNFFSYLFFMVLFVSATNAQTKPKIKNINIESLGKQLFVNFDIENSAENDSFEIEMNFMDENFYYVPAYSLIGDVGEKVAGGKNKTIVWNVSRDRSQLDNKLYPNISLNGVPSTRPTGGGAGNVFLSMLVPGLGDYFVAKPKDMKFKPYMRTAAVLGCFLLGYYAKTEYYYDEVFEPAHDESYIYDGELRFRPVPDRYVKGAGHSMFFENDHKVLFTIGAAIWTYDIIWVLVRGARNTKLRSNNKLYFSLAPTGQMQFNITMCINT